MLQPVVSNGSAYCATFILSDTPCTVLPYRPTDGLVLN